MYLVKNVSSDIAECHVELKPGEIKKVGNFIVEKTEDGRIIVYEVVDKKKVVVVDVELLKDALTRFLSRALKNLFIGLLKPYIAAFRKLFKSEVTVEEAPKIRIGDEIITIEEFSRKIVEEAFKEVLKGGEE